jgi:acyl-CoA synthetase (NDP forming)
VTSADQAGRATVRVGVPAAVKADAGRLLHKSDVGGVRLGLETADQVAEAIVDVQRLSGVDGVPVLVQGMAPGGVELIVSLWTDDVFGSVLMVGSGGRLVELVRDVQIWLGPLDVDDAVGLLSRLACYPLLTGFRGGRPADVRALAELLSRLSGLAGTSVAGGRLRQLEINPLIVGEHDVLAVDLRGTVAEATRERPALRPLPDFDRLFRPATVAVIGAARRPTIPTRIVGHLLDYGYDGRLVLVNRRAAEDGGVIHGLSPVADIDDLPERIDYGIVAVSAAEVPATVARLGQRAAFVQVITSGFGEADDEGRDREEELKAVLSSTGARVLGPNCLGIHSTPGRVTFVDGLRARTGPVSVVSQSGGLAADILRQGQARGIGFNHLVTIGNAVDLAAEDFLEAFASDEDSRVIGLYLEGTSDGERLRRLLGEARARGKRVVLLHGGRTDSGARAAASHTGALSGADTLWSAMARQTGTTYVHDLDDFLTALAGHSLLEPSRAGRVVLVGPSGGMSVLASDLAAELGLEIAQLGEQARARLAAIDAPPGSSLSNPIDTPAGALAVDDGDLVSRIVVAATADAGSVDHVIVHLNPQTAASYTGDGPTILRNVARAVADLHAQMRAEGSSTQVMLALRPNGETDVQRLCHEVLEPLREACVPTFLGLEQALRAVRFVVEDTAPATDPAPHRSPGD